MLDVALQILMGTTLPREELTKLLTQWRTRILLLACLIASVTLKQHFWISYGLMCLAIPGPFAAMAPFWAIPSEG